MQFKKGMIVVMCNTIHDGLKGKVTTVSETEIGVRVTGYGIFFMDPENLKPYGGFKAVSFNPPARKHFK